MRTETLRTASTAFLLLFAVPFLVGCGSDSPVATQVQDVSGTYTLSTVGGVETPLVLFEDETATVELLDGVISLDQDGSFLEVLTFRETAAGEAEGEVIELETPGTYTMQGDAAVFSSADGAWQGTVANGAITYVIWDVPFTFRR